MGLAKRSQKFQTKSSKATQSHPNPLNNLNMTIAPSYYEAIMQGNMVFNRAPSPIGDKRNLSPNFVPSDYDVICGKGTFLLQICVLFYPH